MNISDIYNFLDLIAPFNTSFSWDNSGFLIGNINTIFKSGLICLDITEEIIDECINKRCNLLISHHPIIFNKLNKVTSDMLVYKIIKNDINVISLHTNLDMADNGVNFALAQTLNLSNLSPLSTEINNEFNYKVCTFIHRQYENQFKQNISGLCTLINQKCSPIEQDSNLKIELIVHKKHINNILNQIMKIHPYNYPQYEISKIYNKQNFTPVGLIGTTDDLYTPDKFCQFIKEKLSCKKISYISGNKNINTVAVCSGSGANFIKYAISNNVDAYVTAEIKYNIWLEAKKLGLTLIDAGHFNTENIICEYLVNTLNNHFKTNKFNIADNNKDIIDVI